MQKSAGLKERLVFRRNALNLTQEDLAEKSGVSLRSISNYESGDLPTLESLFKLAEALGVKPGYFLGDDIEEVGPALRDRESKSGGGVYSHLETETLMKSMAELSAKLWRMPAHERKYVLGNLRSILDELEERELMGEHKPSESKSPGDRKDIAGEMARRGIAAGDESEVSSGQTASQRIVEAVKHKAAGGHRKPRGR